MPAFKVKIIQTFTLYRALTVEVEAETLDAAVESIECRVSPPIDDPRWIESRYLESEHVEYDL